MENYNRLIELARPNEVKNNNITLKNLNFTNTNLDPRILFIVMMIL